MTNSSAVFTVCNIAYLPKALALADSCMRNGERLKIYLFDVKCDIKLPHHLADFCWVEDLGVPNFHSYAFRYDIVEFSTSLKPWITLFLLKNHDKVIFLDPDTYLFSSLDEVNALLENHPVILTPHYVTPHIDGDMGMMRFGSFNLGFFAVSKGEQARAFLQWWSERCLEYCYFETQFGLSTDQKWVSIAPCFFPFLHVSFDLGLNAAFWNLHERSIQKGDGCYRVNNKFTLKFFHFSSFDEAEPYRLSKRSFPGQEMVREDLISLIDEYHSCLKSFHEFGSGAAYGYDYMSGGEYISPTLRRAYAAVCHTFPPDTNPFDSNGVVMKFAKDNFLLEKSGAYKVAGFSDKGGHSRKFKAINLLMRLLLRVLGPNRFMNLSRLFVYLSSYRINRELWKI